MHLLKHHHRQMKLRSSSLLLLLSFSPTGSFTTSSEKPSTTCLKNTAADNSNSNIMTPADPWNPFDKQHIEEARKLDVWPLDKYNAKTLDEVHPRSYTQSTTEPHQVYDLIAIGAGAGGLVSSKQTARRGGKAAMISAHLAGGDCLNVGCVPSKALLRAAKAIKEVKRAAEFGISLGGAAPTIDFKVVMNRLRERRSVISPADGHDGTSSAGTHVFQGFGKFTSPNTIEVNGKTLTFKKAVVATGGRPTVPDYPGLKEAPYTTNEVLFNLEELPPRMVVLGSGVIALEMAQCFAAFGTHVTVIQRAERLFQSKGGDQEGAALLQKILTEDGVTFLSKSTIANVETLRERSKDTLPLMKVTLNVGEEKQVLECECLLVATGRASNVENLGLEEAGVEYQLGKGVTVNDLAQSVSNENVYAVGDCAAGVPRLTHMSGEMAKQAVQNALFGDDWKLIDFVVPAVMYTEPEYATVGIESADQAARKGIEVDVYRGGLEHNDRAILESDQNGFCKIVCEKGTGKIIGATIVAARAGEIINEVTLAMKHNISLDGIGRNIHPYPTTGEAVMGAGLQYINSKWTRLD
eukprot:CAMPEP_0119004920 /NCGR_PEP_ID=MMETSP1176-20130426/1433_1 /TAXON_ID=265551 /ORGANISM="Synedropsis recta cf, Strain CCMP1620" /LENGTH=579 /DNA_ID=CAMNT_0006956681 /DNA_START=114 /DNA_END=1853 /DNA_ORIENTATION=-